MKIRRFVGKRRRKAARRWADRLAGSHACTADRQQLQAFSHYLEGRMTPDQERAYETGEQQHVDG